MKRFVYLWALCGLLSFGACSEEYVGQTQTDSDAPLSIENVEVKNTPGGAEIYYTLTAETDISYVKGVYQVKGKERVTRSSVYNNVLKVEGLGSTDPLEVALYVVDHSENHSKPYVVTIHPLTPVVEQILNTMQMQADFGGVNVTWENEMETEIGITFLASNEEGVLEEGPTYYNQLKVGNYTFRGYDAKPQTFGIFLTDKWGNVSDTIQKELTPIFEVQFDKKLFKRIILPLDNNKIYGKGYEFEKMFDDNMSTIWHTWQGGGLPICSTIDLGQEVTLGRFKLYHRQGPTFYFQHFNPKKFEIWGCTSYKEGMLEDYWKEEWKQDWTMLGDYEIIKPSGGGPVTNEDIEYASNGFEFSVPLTIGKVRYLRLCVKETCSGASELHIAELTFWGDNQ